MREGGHDIPLDAIERRFAKSLRNLLESYLPICDCVYCYDNSEPEFKLVFSKHGSEISVFEEKTYLKIGEFAHD